MKDWLNDSLKVEVREIFEPKYDKELSDAEVIEIANNLVSGIEAICKLKQNQIYGK